jgi:hypothetical protein
LFVPKHKTLVVRWYYHHNIYKLYR